MARQEWRARAKLTGDPVKDGKTREEMLDALHESMRRSRDANAAMRGGLRPPVTAVHAVTGEPVREIEGTHGPAADLVIIDDPAGAQLECDCVDGYEQDDTACGDEGHCLQWMTCRTCGGTGIKPNQGEEA